MGIFDGYDTDKGNGYHSYEDVYRGLFDDSRSRRRFDVQAVLELGIFRGGSLKAWRDYFPNAEIVGMDCDPSTMIVGEPRISTRVGDVKSGANLKAVGQLRAPYDLIVDDASHRPVDQFHALRRLWPYVRTGGYYVIEDLDLNRNFDIIGGCALIVRGSLTDFQIHLGPGTVPADDLLILEKS